MAIIEPRLEPPGGEAPLWRRLGWLLLYWASGVLAVWSAAPDPGFTRRLRGAGFVVEMVTVKARPNGKGPRHVIWFARR